MCCHPRHIICLRVVPSRRAVWYIPRSFFKMRATAQYFTTYIHILSLVLCTKKEASRNMDYSVYLLTLLIADGILNTLTFFFSPSQVLSSPSSSLSLFSRTSDQESLLPPPHYGTYVPRISIAIIFEYCIPSSNFVESCLPTLYRALSTVGQLGMKIPIRRLEPSTSTLAILVGIC